MAPNKKIVDQNNYSKFGTRPPDIITITCMKDKKSVDNDILNRSLESPIDSSTLTKKQKTASKASSDANPLTTAANFGSCDKIHEMSIDSCVKIHEITSDAEQPAELHKESFLCSTRKTDDSLNSNESLTDPVMLLDIEQQLQLQKLSASNSQNTSKTSLTSLQIDTSKTSRRLPTIPATEQLRENALSTTTTATSTDILELKKQHLVCLRTASLPTSPCVSPGSIRKPRSSSIPPKNILSRKSNSLTERVRNSLRKRPPPIQRQAPIDVDSNMEPDNLFRNNKERECYEYAKKRGRRGAVISLEVSQSVSFVKSSTGKDRYLEFSFVPKTP